MVMRWSHSFSMHKQIIPLILPPLHMMITFFIVLVSIFSIFSIIAFLCGSHNFPGSQGPKEERTVRLGGGGDQTKLQSSIGTKALLMVKMISWRKMQHPDHDINHDQECCNSSGDDEEAVWKRTIIMGERCRPLEFSGKILYDSHGNPLHDSLIRPTSTGK